MRKCVTRRAPSSSSAGAIPICYGGDRLSQAPPCPCMKYQIRNFFDGGRHAEGRDVERYGARERAEEEGRIRRRPRGEREEGEAGRDARYLRIQIKSPGRHVGEKKSGVVYRSSSYLTAKPDSEIYLAPSPSFVSRGCGRTRSLDRRTSRRGGRKRYS